MKKKEPLKKQQNVMLALDLTKMDSTLLSYASYLSEVLNIEHFYFTHNIKRSKLYNLYEDLLEEGITLEEIVEEALEKSIAKNYTGKTDYTLAITSDDYTESILEHLSKKYSIDLLLVGYKSELQGTGALTQKLVRMIDAGILMIPEETKYQLHKILVATDFSNASVKAFQAAKHLTKKSKGKIEAIHVYNIPSFFYPYINTQKAVDKTQKNLQEKTRQFRKKNQMTLENVNFHELDREENSVAGVIEDFALNQNFDLLIVSARGANNLTSLFIGSVTNDLIIRAVKTPLLVVK
ncbi:universal stress protein [Mesonia ostreae]|uniref:Universal stress protein n=1 Tax=Mesonia ostreae TaxID=861110 RepID=A0ABU2KGH7_9FLAO|nr:universal stress protein [Mesonia ostreae]MDT0293796.1 universal stress protein [Mesonia ostreae]